jgi:hypothetical protein
MNVYKNFTYYHCKIFELPDHKKHFNLLTTDIMNGKAESSPTFVHITSLRAKKFSLSGAQTKFIWNALKLTNETEMMTDDISWKDVALPLDGRGRQPKNKKTKTEKKKKTPELKAHL